MTSPDEQAMIQERIDTILAANAPLEETATAEVPPPVEVSQPKSSLDLAENDPVVAIVTNNEEAAFPKNPEVNAIPDFPIESVPTAAEDSKPIFPESNHEATIPEGESDAVLPTSVAAKDSTTSDVPRIKSQLTIALLGSGFAGTMFAYSFDKAMNDARYTKKLRDAYAKTTGDLLDDSVDVEFVWISRMPALDHNMGHLRAVVDKASTDAFFTPIDKLWPSKQAAQGFFKTRYCHGDILSVESHSVRFQPLNNAGEPEGTEATLHFDYSILAMGSNTPYPSKNDSTSVEIAKKNLNSIYDALKAAKSVVVIGAGAVGLELSAEVKSTYPECTVTVVESNEDVMHYDHVNGYVSEKMQNKVVRWWQTGVGVKFIFSERVVSPLATTIEPCSVKLQSGEEISADVVLFCVGNKLNVGPLEPLCANSQDCELMQGRKAYVPVNDHFQVNGYPHIFALGDLVDTGESKLGYIASLHGEHAGKQILPKLLKAHILHLGHSQEAFDVPTDDDNKAVLGKRYKKQLTPRKMLTAGRKGGYFQLSQSIVLGHWAMRLLKCKDMGLSLMMRNYGYKPNYVSDFDAKSK